MKFVMAGLVAVLLVAGGALVTAQAGEDVRAEITKLMKAYDAISITRDPKAMEPLFDDDAQIVQPNGKLLNKREYVAIATDNKRIYKTSKTETHSIRLLGDTAIQISTYTATGRSRPGNEPFKDRFRVIDVWARKGGKWVITAEMATEIPNTK